MTLQMHRAGSFRHCRSDHLSRCGGGLRRRCRRSRRRCRRCSLRGLLLGFCRRVGDGLLRLLCRLFNALDLDRRVRVPAEALVKLMDLLNDHFQRGIDLLQRC